MKLHVGDKVSVAEIRIAKILTGAVHHATVTEISPDSFVCHVHVVGPNMCWREFEDEGTTWCRGWEGRDVDALRAGAVLA